MFGILPSIDHNRHLCLLSLVFHSFYPTPSTTSTLTLNTRPQLLIQSTMNFYYDFNSFPLSVTPDPPAPPLPAPPPPVNVTVQRRKPSSSNAPPSLESIDVSSMPIFPSSIPAPYCIASNQLSQHLPPPPPHPVRLPLSNQSTNRLIFVHSHSHSPAPASGSKPSGRNKKSTTPSIPVHPSPQQQQSHHQLQNDHHLSSDGVYLAPDYLLNPAGPASSSETDFKCPNCDKIYKGKHARSIWRRHLQDKHGIPLSQQPRRTRWDNGESDPSLDTILNALY